MNRFAMILSVMFLLAGRGASAADVPPSALTIGKHRLSVEVVTTPEKRAVGLMHRFSLKPDHGMLFVFERSEPQSFWMKNTYIPLSIAFVGEDGRIINIDDMQPQSEQTHWSRGPARFAIEMKKGWFAERGILPGATVSGLPAVGK